MQTSLVSIDERISCPQGDAFHMLRLLGFKMRGRAGSRRNVRLPNGWQAVSDDDSVRFLDPKQRVRVWAGPCPTFSADIPTVQYISFCPFYSIDVSVQGDQDGCSMTLAIVNGDNKRVWERMRNSSFAIGSAGCYAFIDRETGYICDLLASWYPRSKDALAYWDD